MFDHDDVLHPSVLYEYVKVINEQKADYIYCDETTFKGDSIDNMITLHFKPDFSIDNLRANSPDRPNISISQLTHATDNSYEYLGRYYELKEEDSNV